MDILNFNSMINHFIQKTILSGNDMSVSLSKDIL